MFTYYGLKQISRNFIFCEIVPEISKKITKNFFKPKNWKLKLKTKTKVFIEQKFYFPKTKKQIWRSLLN